MDVSKLEQMLQALQGQVGISPQVINEYNQIITNFQLSQEGLLWCIQQFPCFQSKSLIAFALSTFRMWINSNWEYLTQDLINNLKILLFSQAKLISNDINLTQATIQVNLFQHLYPENWPSFWKDLLSLNPQIVLYFLQEFVNPINDIDLSIIYQMQADNSESAVVQFVISSLENGANEAFPILTQMLGWIDPNPVLQSSIISLIQRDLALSTSFIANYNANDQNNSNQLIFQQNVNKLDCVIKLLNGIVTSSIDPSVLNNLLTQLNIIETMMLICQNPNFHDVMGSASSLISSCAQIFFETPAAPQYYQLSLLLLSHPSIDVAQPILNFINKFTLLGNAEIAQNSFQALSNRFGAYFALNPTEIDEFASFLLKVISNILHQNNGLLDAYINSFLISHGSIDSINPCNLAALFIILIDAVENKIKFAKCNEIAIAFSAPLLQKSAPPYPDPVYYAVSSYMMFLTRIASQFQSDQPNQEYMNAFPPMDIFQAMFISLLNNLIIPYDEESNFKIEKFISIANSFIRTKIFNKFINVSVQNIVELVKTNNFEIIQISSKLLPKFNYAERTNIFRACMELMINSIVSNNDKNKQKEFIHLMLLMIQNQTKVQNVNENNAEMVQVVIPYMEKILPTASNNGEIMVLFLDTLYKSLGKNGLPLLLSMINNGAIREMEGLAKAFEIMQQFVKECENNGNELAWVNDSTYKLFMIMSQLIQSVSNWFDISEETKEARHLLIKCFDFISKSSQFLCNELNQQLIDFTCKLFPILFKLADKEPIRNSINYLHSLVLSPMLQNDPNFLGQVMIQNIVPLTFQIFIDKSFNPHSAEWRLTIYAILNLHQNLLKVVPDKMSQKLIELFNQLPRSDMTQQALNQYVALLQRNENPSTFYLQIQEVLIFIQKILHNI